MTDHRRSPLLPALSHLQFAVLGALLDGELAGRDIRARLAALNVRQTGPAFYQMMARLEDGGLVEGWYVQDVVSGQSVKERRYRVTPAGSEAWHDTRAFYVEASRGIRPRKGLSHV